jgi:hypothetical protein
MNDEGTMRAVRPYIIVTVKARTHKAAPGNAVKLFI